jgi:hypothetical protein
MYHSQISSKVPPQTIHNRRLAPVDRNAPKAQMPTTTGKKKIIGTGYFLK